MASTFRPPSVAKAPDDTASITREEAKAPATGLSASGPRRIPAGFVAPVHPGYRCENSPLCIPDGTPPPHAWLSSGRSTPDPFGRGFVLLDFDGDAGACAAMAEAAAAARIPFEIETIADAGIAALYEARFVPVRPDGDVAWRSDAMHRDPAHVLATVTGNATAT